MNDALRERARVLRRALQARTLSRSALLDALQTVPFRDRDVWVDELLALDAPPDDVDDLPRGAVPYVPCGVDAIVHAVREAPVRSDDVFVDLGGGLGRVALLVHLLTGARAVAVELQEHLVGSGRQAASALDLGNDCVSFVVGDAATHVVEDGTVFFIYASFSPAVLRAVLRALEHMASTRAKPFVLCAVGFDVHDAPWLRARASQSPELMFYESLQRRGSGT